MSVKLVSKFQPASPRETDGAILVGIKCDVDETGQMHFLVASTGTEYVWLSFSDGTDFCCTRGAWNFLHAQQLRAEDGSLFANPRYFPVCENIGKKVAAYRDEKNRPVLKLVD